MKNKNLILLLAAAAAYYFLFMKKKQPSLQIEQPGFSDQPGTAQPGQQALTAPAIQTESVSIVDEIKNFSAPARQLEHKQDEVYQTYYVNQVSGVKKMGVPFTI